MFTDVKSKLHDEAIRDLLELAVYPDPDRLDDVLAAYRTDDGLSLYGYQSEGEWVGILGFHLDENTQIADIKHIAVHPEARGKGFGRGMVVELILAKEPETVVAETDEDSVNFYRSIGFSVVSLGEKYPSVERFKCTYLVSDEAEDEEEGER
jgi:ribosomal protein S18 acetylase RimI-like enzyme